MKGRKLDENRQKPAETGAAKRLGRRPKNHLHIDWQARAEQLWKTYPRLKKSIGDLRSAAEHADPEEIGDYENFRRKFNGTLGASPAHADALFKATEFDRVGVSLDDWIAKDDQWGASIANLSPVDPVDLLASHAAKGGMAVAASSTPSREPRMLRRLQLVGAAETELHINEYMQLTISFDSGDPAPVYLMALEWSERSRDWQVFNMIEESQLDHSKPRPVSVRGDSASVQVSIGLPIGGPPDTFDLFVLAKRAEFDHRARSRLDNLKGQPVLTPLEMGRVLHELFAGPAAPQVATTRYRVV